MSRRNKGRLYVARLDSLDQRVLDALNAMGSATAAQVAEVLDLPVRRIAQSCRRLRARGDAYHHATFWDRKVWAAGGIAVAPQRLPRCLFTRRAWPTMQAILQRGPTTTAVLAEAVGVSVRVASRALIAAEQQGWVIRIAWKWQSASNTQVSYWAIRDGLQGDVARYVSPAKAPMPLTTKAAIEADNDAWFARIQAEQAAKRTQRGGCQDMAAMVLNRREQRA